MIPDATRRRTDKARKPLRHCSRCFGLAHRREDGGKCSNCGELFAPEVITPSETQQFSSAVTWVEW